MKFSACSLDADELVEQLERYRAIGRLAAGVEHEPGRVVVRFAGDPPSALIERTLQVERGCCPFFEIDYEPATQRLAISVDHPDHRPGLDAIAHALTKSPATGLVPGSETGELQAVPGDMSCCSPAALEACCEPEDKQSCCGQSLGGETAVASPSRCGCGELPTAVLAAVTSNEIGGLWVRMSWGPADGCSRHPIAREVEQDQEEVARIVEEWMGRPPAYEAPYDEAELERKIEVAFWLDARERVPSVRAVAAWLAASSMPRGAGRAPGPRRGGSDPAEPARSVGEAASRSDCKWFGVIRAA